MAFSMEGLFRNLFLIIVLNITFLVARNDYKVSACADGKASVTCMLEYGGSNKYSFKKLNLTVSHEGLGISHIFVKNMEAKRYEVPREVFSDKYRKKISKEKGEKVHIPFHVEERPILAIPGVNNSTLITLFQSSLHFQDDVLKFDYVAESDKIFGYGERIGKLRLTEGIYTIWPKDPTATGPDDGTGGKSTYGFFPFMLIKNKAEYVGVLFVNTNAQDLRVGRLGRRTTLTQISIGGIIELLVFSRPTAIETIKVLHNIIGKPALPPFWALGWHHSKWGFKNTGEMRDTEMKYVENKLPLDTMWVDIDYMSGYQDFTINPNFNDLPQYVNELHARDRHFVPIIDMGISVYGSYYTLGLELDTFIKSNYTKGPLINQVWPGRAAFPDFMTKTSYKFWGGGLKDLHHKVKFDGIWLDMNEPAAFKTGEFIDTNIPDMDKYNKYKNLIYFPGGRNFSELQASLNAQLKAGDLFNLKSVNTFYQIALTNKFLKTLEKRPFILTRSFLFGNGRHTAKWSGDNESSYINLKVSILDIFNLQIAGFNLAGADICGFHKDATDDLCARWHALGAFYPFSRNHRDISNSPQEPWALGSKTLQAADLFINLKYSIMRYYYTQLYLASMNGGVTFQPVFFQFDDDALIEDEKVLGSQIMIGPALLFIPALESGTSNYEGMFPRSNWNYFPSGKRLLSVEDFDENKSTVLATSLSGKYNAINLFIRGGHIVPYQDSKRFGVGKSMDLFRNKITLIINPDEFGNASGEIIYDNPDELQENTLDSEGYYHIALKFNKNILTIDILNMVEYSNDDIEIESIKILNTKKKNKDVTPLKVKHLKFLNEEDWDIQEGEEHTVINFYPTLSMSNPRAIKLYN